MGGSQKKNDTLNNVGGERCSSDAEEMTSKWDLKVYIFS